MYITTTTYVVGIFWYIFLPMYKGVTFKNSKNVVTVW